MTRILAVDDSRAIRSIVAKQVSDLGFDVDEAEDGEQGLARLAERQFDLVLLDVTMPVLDGPGMLRRMRQRGDHTPVLMLTSESKRAIIAECMKLGIDDYILKPFKPEELRVKMGKAMPGVVVSAAPAASATAAQSSRADAPAVGAGKAGDVLVVDDMDNVARKLRALVPAHLGLDACTTGQAALTMCRERHFRLILIDTDIPETNSAALMSQLRLLQPGAMLTALSLRSVHDAERIARVEGYDGLIQKPFQQAEIDDLFLKVFDSQDLLRIQDNVLRPGACPPRADQAERYFRRLHHMVGQALERIAAACFDCVVFDLSELPLRPDVTPHLVTEIDRLAEEQGLRLLLVGPPDARELLQQFRDTAAVPFYGSVADARSA
jgi:CheY-like chemotaxis protein